MSTDTPARHSAPPDPVAEQGTAQRRRKLIVIAVLAAALLLVSGALLWYLITKKPVTDIPGLSREQMPTFSYSIYGVDSPMGVAVSSDGERVYVTQTGGKRTVVEFDHKGNVLNVFAAPRDDKTKLADHVPMYVAVNPTNDDVYVSDRRTKAVYVYTSTGTYKRTVTPKGLTGTWAPLGLAFDQDGNLYATEIGGKTHRVVVLKPDDTVLRTMTSPDLPMEYPNGLAVDGDGHILVTDSNNGRLLAFDRDGNQLASVNRGIAAGDLGLPRGLAIDDRGRITVVDTTNQGIRVYRLGEEDGRWSLSFSGAAGDEGIADGLFEFPNGVATDTRSNVYVTDRENNRVQVWSY